MSALLGFFTAGPSRVAGLLYGAGALLAALAVVGLLALWWRGEMIEARSERDLAKVQIELLSNAVQTCNASVDHAKRAADAAVKGMAALLAEAKRLKAPARHTVERIERIIKEPAPPGADCGTAWDLIEQEAR